MDEYNNNNFKKRGGKKKMRNSHIDHQQGPLSITSQWNLEKYYAIDMLCK